MDELPPELLLKIANLLPGRDLVALSGANRAMFQLLSHERRLWKKRLDEIKFPGYSNLSKASDALPNCPEKDEFIFQTRLRANWRNGDFNLTEAITLPGRWYLGCQYADFIVYFSRDQPMKNSWHLMWLDDDTGTIASGKICLPKTAGANNANLYVQEMAMSSKTTAIIRFATWPTLGQNRKLIWAIDISRTNNIRTLWRNEINDPMLSMEVANNQVCVLVDGLTAKVDIYSSGRGELVRSVNLAPWDPSWFLRGFVRNRLRTVGQEYRMLPIRAQQLNGQTLFVLDLKEGRFPDTVETFQNRVFMWVGPNLFAGRVSSTICKFMNWTADPVLREILPGENLSLRASVKPNGQLVAVQSDHRGVACFFDLLGKNDDETSFRRKRIKGRKFKTRTSELHHDTLIDYSSFEKKRILTFTSFDPKGRASEVQKPLQTPEGFELVQIRCLSSTAVAFFRRTQEFRPTFIVAFDFKPR